MLISKISALLRSASTPREVSGSFPSIPLRLQKSDHKREFVELRAVHEIQDKFCTELHSVELYWLQVKQKEIQ